MASNGYDVRVTYITPVPPGFAAIKNKVTVASGIPYEQVKPTLASIYAMMKDIQDAFAEADPYKGWAPFVFGTTVVPTGWGL